MEVNNGLSGYDLIEHQGLFNLYRFDLTINGSKLPVGTRPDKYAEREAAIRAGDEWIELHRILVNNGDTEKIRRIICKTLDYIFASSQLEDELT